MANTATGVASESPAPQVRSPLAVRAEHAIQRAFGATAVGTGCPPRLADAQRYALFPGGARLRPQLCLLTSIACGDVRPLVADAAAAAIEFLHCASLVHDDLPCFDDADLRRGKPALHKVFGEALAVLVGDAFIVHSFDVLARGVASAPRELAEMLPTLASAAGTTKGLLAGQAWESEPAAPLDEYHGAKTASLFEAAAAMGAIACDEPPHPWRRVGYAIGRAYQASDDVLDAAGGGSASKSGGRDVALGRPSLVRSIGIDSSRERVSFWLERAHARVPECAGRPLVTTWIERLAEKLENQRRT